MMHIIGCLVTHFLIEVAVDCHGGSLCICKETWQYIILLGEVHNLPPTSVRLSLLLKLCSAFHRWTWQKLNLWHKMPHWTHWAHCYKHTLHHSILTLFLKKLENSNEKKLLKTFNLQFHKRNNSSVSVVNTLSFPIFKNTCSVSRI